MIRFSRPVHPRFGWVAATYYRMPVKFYTVPMLFVLSVAATVGTGWLVFSGRTSASAMHAAFLLCVGASVACGVLLLAKGLPVTPQEREKGLDAARPRNAPRDRDRGAG